MAKKISQLTQATEVKSDDVTIIVQDGETKKLPLNMMVTKQDIENKKIAGLAKLDEIEATYENDTYTPTITVKNKSSVKTGEGDEVDYSANVMDGHVKSAILTGNTLVNLVNNSNEEKEVGKDNNKPIKYNYVYPLTKSKEYTLQFEVINFNSEAPFTFSINNGITGFDTEIINKDGVYKFKITLTSNNASELWFYWPRGTFVDGYTSKVKNIILLEGDYTNVDIPYFEGMQSVKLPVLTTIGKNVVNPIEDLFVYRSGFTKPQVLFENGGFNFISEFNGSICGFRLPVKLLKDEMYYVKCDYENMTTIRLYGSNVLSDEIDTTWETIVIDQNGGRFSFNKQFDYYYVAFYPNQNSRMKIKNLQIEQGSTATPYEPYKTNILSTSEDVTLRGIGDVKDELNCLTGEVVEHFNVVTVNGNENWSTASTSDDTLMRFYTTNIIGYPNGEIICGKFNSFKTNMTNREGVVLWNSSGNLNIVVSKSKLTEESTNGFKQYLSNNPLTVQYQLTTESIKTVDLMPSGTHPSTTPYCWKNGHIQLSSSGLLPNLEYSVVTSRAGQINQNATMIVKNDKRIFDLEILLAGGLVNTTYQALTLQNQVETGLSKVSLNSETEPDYLLYHMIMKLIEEKAYKLDDLTEKVSVFYLYEKLSDEQFETIYSALYPFVEDEIVEEPVVEELPEVVEDEVIM